MKDVTLAEFVAALDERVILVRDVLVVGNFIYGQPTNEGETMRAPL